ncbi:hypothetical protein HaLaN_07148, partial [Haematococcus lacustris]
MESPDHVRIAAAVSHQGSLSSDSAWLETQWCDVLCLLQATVARLTIELQALRQAMERRDEEVKVLEERLSAACSGEVAVLANMRSVKAQQSPHTGQRCAGGSFPVGFGSVEQRECLDQLSIATEQLASTMLTANNLQYPPVRHLMKAAKGSLDGTASLVSSWDRDSCAAALHHHVLNTALDIAQQQEDWYQHTAGALFTNYLACLTSCPESGRTELHAVLQQLQQAKSSTLFLPGPQWLEAPPSFLGACAQDLSPGGAGCPGSDTQDTRLPLLQTVDQVQQLVADLRHDYNRSVAKEQFDQEWDRAQVDKEELDKQAAADKAALAILTEKMQDLEWELLERTETVQGLEKQLAEANADKERALAEMGRVKARITQLTTEVSAMQTGRSQLVEQVEVLGERLASRAAQEEEPAAELRLSKELLQTAEAQLAQLGNGSSVGLDSSSGEGKVHLGPYTAQRCAGGSFPVGFGSVEQRECLDQLSVATEQLACIMVPANNFRQPLTQHLLEAAKGSLEGTAALVSSWERDSCAAALHHHVLNTALGIAQQQVDWYQHTAGAVLAKYLACLTSCPESGRTGLHAVLQQLQQAKSSTLFLVAQQQAPSHPATREASQYMKDIDQYMQEQLQQQLGLTYSYHQACVAWRPELVAVAAAMTRVNLLLASLQSSCPGLQLVSRLEEQVAQEGQGACEAPVRQLLGKVEVSRPLFLVRPGLVCAAAGGGRQVMVRQQAVQLVPDPAWLEQQQRLKDEAARKQQEEREWLEAEEEHRRKQAAQRLLEEERLAKEEQRRQEKDAAAAKLQDEQQKVLHEEPK